MAMFNDIVIFPGGGGGDGYIVSFPGGKWLGGKTTIGHRQHGNVSIMKIWSLNDNMIERLLREIELEIERV